MSMVLNVEILGEFKKLTAATQGSAKDLGSLSTQASKVSKKINTAFAAIGIGLSFRALANELEDATKAAIEDRKSQELLANAMVNTTGATDDQIAAAEKAIAKLESQTSVADDKLRPAYQKLFLATKDVTESNKLLSLALDVSAGTGKDLDTVSQAMAKSLAGSDTALLKLIPSLKGSKTPLDDLATAFGGAAQKAADLDPYARLQITFDNIQEKLGTALLPVLDKFSQWLASPGGQAELQKIVDVAADILTKLGNVAMWAAKNKDWLLPLAGSIIAISGIVKAIDGITTAIETAKAAQLLFNGVVAASPYIALSGGVVAAGAAGAAVGGYQTGMVAGQTAQIYAGTGSDPFSGFKDVGKVLTGQKPTSNVNVTINTPKMSAQDIIRTVNNYERTGGIGLINRLTR